MRPIEGLKRSGEILCTFQRIYINFFFKLIIGFFVCLFVLFFFFGGGGVQNIAEIHDDIH